VEVRPAHVLGLGCIVGLGFTVALFVGNLAYTDTAMIQHAKIGIFTGSLLPRFSRPPNKKRKP
jgi:Na+:H+ antiporter, NhaA family